MDTLKDIKTDIADMGKYCKIINSDATMPCKVAFANMIRYVALRIAKKCDKLEKELEKELEDEQKETEA